MKTEFPYTRLPGRRRGLVLSASLWMGADHFLLVRNTRFSESYKRFFYKDVQAILIRRGPRFSIPPYWLIAFVLIAVTGGVLSFRRQLPSPWMVFGPLAALIVWLLVESLFLSCTTYIRTAVSSEELTALFRTRHALRALDLLSAKIEAEQGPLAPESIPPAAVPLAEQRPEVHQVRPSETALNLSLASFLFLFVDAGFTYFTGSGPLSRAMNIANSALILIETALLIAALVKLWPGAAARGLRNLIIASLVFAGAAYYAGSMGVQFSESMAQANLPIQAGLFLQYRKVVNSIDEVGNLILGIAGLIQWRKAARR